MTESAKAQRTAAPTADDKNVQLVLAYFASKEQAEQAADALKGWDKANEDVKLGARLSGSGGSRCGGAVADDLLPVHP
jgi:hypothetical protein